MSKIISMENTTHWILQGKGGVGKSLSASMLAQYLRERGYTPVCGDTDPVNSTFHQIEDLNVSLVDIARDGVIIQSQFDPLFESILTSGKVSVIDNGASTFLPFTAFIKSNYILKTMQEYKKKVFIHVILTAAQAKDDTASGLLAIMDLVKQSGTDTKVVVWVNEFWGVPEYGGMPLEQAKWFIENASTVQGIVRIIQRAGDDFVTSVRHVTEQHLTCRQVKASDQFGIMSKSRIFRVFDDVYTGLDAVFKSDSAPTKKDA